MDYKNIDTHNPVFRALQEISTILQHTRPTHYMKTEPTTQKDSEQIHIERKNLSEHQQNYVREITSSWLRNLSVIRGETEEKKRHETVSDLRAQPHELHSYR
jgi:hypothetical protein